MAKAIMPADSPAIFGDRLDRLPTAARRLRVTLSVLGDMLERLEERRAELVGDIAANPIWKFEAEEFDVLLSDAFERAQAIEDELFALSDNVAAAETEARK